MAITVACVDVTGSSRAMDVAYKEEHCQQNLWVLFGSGRSDVIFVDDNKLTFFIIQDKFVGADLLTGKVRVEVDEVEEADHV